MITVWLLFLLVLANGAPVVAARLLHDRLSAPLDGGMRLGDGQPLFGRSKTWRGLVSGVLACAVLAPVMGLGVLFGVAFAALALGGDLLSSFIKRRMALEPSARASGLDQLPESVLPVGYAWWQRDFPLWQATGVVLLFVTANMVFSPLLYQLGIRKQPH
ncbi:CDP-archaeol synthase [Marinobacter bryozoorum]|uniref:CDP-archaeol synthase n=1 Tax=Marinobacter bryozoorum TaxID=256324 RepID=UPI002006B0F2|nr:CDP-archaeol synthase [Marinobacter bryozoorum]MCK7543988.1 CDP-archaeol synthase [Marinobacter bryozoorum]